MNKNIMKNKLFSKLIIGLLTCNLMFIGTGNAMEKEPKKLLNQCIDYIIKNTNESELQSLNIPATIFEEIKKLKESLDSSLRNALIRREFDKAKELIRQGAKIENLNNLHKNINEHIVEEFFCDSIRRDYKIDESLIEKDINPRKIHDQVNKVLKNENPHDETDLDSIKYAIPTISLKCLIAHSVKPIIIGLGVLFVLLLGYIKHLEELALMAESDTCPAASTWTCPAPGI